MPDIYEQFKSRTGTFAPKAAPVAEAPKKTFLQKIFGGGPEPAAPAPVPQKNVDVYDQFKTKTGVFSSPAAPTQNASETTPKPAEPVITPPASGNDVYAQFQAKTGVFSAPGGPVLPSETQNLPLNIPKDISTPPSMGGSSTPSMAPPGTESIFKGIQDWSKKFTPNIFTVPVAYSPKSEEDAKVLKTEFDNSLYGKITRVESLVAGPAISGFTGGILTPQTEAPKDLAGKFLSGISGAVGTMVGITKISKGFGLLAETPATFAEVFDKYPSFTKYVYPFIKNAIGFDVYGQLNPDVQDRLKTLAKDTALSVPYTTLGFLPKAQYSIPASMVLGYGAAKLDGASDEDAFIAGTVLGLLDASGRAAGQAKRFVEGRSVEKNLKAAAVEKLNEFSNTQISQSSSPEDLKKAYLEAAHKTHPDKLGVDTNPDFNAINAAYSFLGGKIDVKEFQQRFSEMEKAQTDVIIEKKPSELPSPDNTKIQEDINKNIEFYRQMGGGVAGTESPSPALRDLNAIVSTPEGRDITQKRVQSEISAGTLKVSPEGTITLYRAGEPGTKNELVSATYDKGVAQAFADEAAASGRTIPLLEFQVEPSDISVFIGKGEAEVLVPRAVILEKAGIKEGLIKGPEVEEAENQFRIESLNEKTMEPDGTNYVVKFETSRTTGRVTVSKYIITGKGEESFVEGMPIEKAQTRFQTTNPKTIAGRMVNPFLGYDYKTEKYTGKVTPSEQGPAKQPKEAREAVATKISELENQVKEKYKAAPGAQEKLTNIIEEMAASEAGKQIAIKDPQGFIVEWTGESSTFPKWIPEELRSKELFNMTLSGRVNIDTIKYPEANQSKRRELYDAVLDELDSELGISTKEERNGIIKLYEARKEIISPEEIDRRLEGSKGGEGIIPEDIFKEPSQKERVKQAVGEGPKNIKEVSKETGILEPNVRRILGVGAKEGTFERIDKGVYVLRTEDGKEKAYIELGDAKDVLARMAKEGERKFDSVILDPAYFSRALIGGNRGIKAWSFIMPEDFASVMESISKLVASEDTHVYLMLSGARTAQVDMDKYVKGAIDAGFKAIGEGGYKKLNKDGSPVTNVRGEEASAERILLMTLSGTAREGEIPTDLNFRFVRPSIAKSYATEKPAELMKALILQSTLEGERVLDPFAGSGVTGAEAIKTGRIPSLIEKSEKAVEEFIKPRLEKAIQDIAEARAEIERNPLTKEKNEKYISEVQQWIDKKTKESQGGESLGFKPSNLNEPSSPKAREETAKIVKRSEIANTISEKFGVPIRRGRFRNAGAIGIFKSDLKLIRYKSGGLPTIFHETGHFIDDKFGFSKYFIGRGVNITERKALVQEYGNGDPYAGDPQRQAKEAFAEFVRFYYTDKDRAQKLAPGFFANYEKRMNELPEVKDVMDSAAIDYKRWLEMPSASRVLSQISFENKDTRGLKEKTVDSFHRLYEMGLDDLHPLEQYTKLAKQLGVPVEDSKNPYVLARLVRGWHGKADTFLEKGTFGRKFWKTEDGKTVPNYTGKGLKDILKPIEEGGALQDLSLFLISKRSLELSLRDIKSGISMTDAKQTIVDVKKAHPGIDFEKVSEDLYKYQDALMNYAMESGLIEEKAIAAMRQANKNYVPFFRVMEELQSRGFMGRGFGNISKITKRIKGSDREIINPLESIVKNTYAIINAAERNAVAISMINLSKMHYELGRMFEKLPKPLAPVQVNVGEVMEAAFGKLGVAMLPPEIQSAFDEKVVTIFKPSFFSPKGELTVLVGGKPQSFKVDPDIYRAMQSLDREQISTLTKILSYPAKFLRAGATLTIDFMVRNPARDQITAYFYSKYGFVPVIDLARGIYSLVGKDSDYWLWRMGGGEHAAIVSMDRASISNNLEELLASKGARGMKYIKNPLEALQILSELGEAGTRLGEMKKALKKGADPVQAAYAAREVTLDFARIGSKTQSVNMLVSFWNANMQGTDKMVRSMKENPYRTILKLLIGAALPSILLYLAQKDDDKWKEIPQWQKDAFWIIIVGDKIFRIPKPYGPGQIFGSLPERILESVHREDPEKIGVLFRTIAQGLNPGIIPTAFSPWIENLTNYSFFLDRPIISDSKEDLPAEAQYTEYTSEFSKEIGKWINYSPIKIDNVIRGYFAGLGTYATNAVDGILSGTGVTNPIPKPQAKLEDMPLVKAFMIKEPIGGASESINQFYQKSAEADSGYVYYNQLIKGGRVKEAQEYLVNHPELKLSQVYGAIRDQLSAMRQAKDGIMKSRSLTPAQKREKLDQMDRLSTDIAAKALEMRLKQ